jgi:YaiO family outer membrane protein
MTWSPCQCDFRSHCAEPGLIVASPTHVFMRSLIAVVLVVSVANRAPAQNSPVWTVQLTHREERLGNARIRAATELGVLRRIGRGAIGADLRWIDESSRSSVGVGTELYAPLWRFSESRLRLFSAPRAASAPDLLVAAEITQHVVAGWQVSLSADDRRYDRGRVQVFLAGAGWSDDRWFLRGRGGAVRTDIRMMATGNVLIRRASLDRRRHVQISASTGGDVFDFADPVTSTPLIAGQSTSAAVHVLHPLTPDFGVTAGVGFGDYGRFGTRAHLEVGVTLFGGLLEAR